MKADWDKLGKQYKDSGSVLIVDADCTADAQQTCQQQGVKGYPTIKYFMAGSKKGHDYQGGRDFAALSAFAAKTLDIAQCDPLTGKNCKDVEKKIIEKYKDMSSAELKTVLAEKTENNKNAKKEYKAAEKAFGETTKAFKKQDKLFGMSSNIINALIKKAMKTEL